MKNCALLTTIFFITLCFSCSSKKEVSIYKPKILIENVSYANDIKPIMLQKCTPCHFPKFGRKEMLDTYDTTKEHIKDILIRVQFPKEDIKFMPFKSKKAPLTENEIELFKNWMNQNFPK